MFNAGELLAGSPSSVVVPIIDSVALVTVFVSAIEDVSNNIAALQIVLQVFDDVPEVNPTLPAAAESLKSFPALATTLDQSVCAISLTNLPSTLVFSICGSG